MKVQILGMECPKCKALEQHTQEAIAELKLDAAVEKIADSDTIMDMRVMMTPALAVSRSVKIYRYRRGDTHSGQRRA